MQPGPMDGNEADALTSDARVRESHRIRDFYGDLLTIDEHPDGILMTCHSDSRRVELDFRAEQLGQLIAAMESIGSRAMGHASKAASQSGPSSPGGAGHESEAR